MKYRILISDNISPKGIELFERVPEFEVELATSLSPEELKERVKEAHALIIRSATKVTAELIDAAKNLKVIGRAGIGLDNVDIKTATKKGIVVMNAPEGNVVTTAEHTIALLMALARNIPQATASLKAGKWEKKRFQGRELYRKTLGIIGLGRIGSIVADRAKGLKMEVIAYDPFVRPEMAEKLGVELVPLEELYQRADFITIHTPLTPETKYLVDKKAFAQMKDGVMIINCARGGIVKESDLYDALIRGKVAGAALDVFEEEPPKDNPLLQLDNVICTPHLGASTEEAQTNVAIAIAEQVIDYLIHGIVRNAVNVPSISQELLATLGPYLTLAEKMGMFHTQVVKDPIKEVEIEYIGEVTKADTQPIKIAALKGLLTPILGEQVNFVNALLLATERGIQVKESKREIPTDFTNVIVLTVHTETGEKKSITGTIFGKNKPRIVRLDGFALEAVPEGHMLLIQNVDRPGVIGNIGTVLGRHQINIGRMHVGQDEVTGQTLILLSTNIPVPKPVLEEIKTLPHVMSAVALEL
ncbi:MAG: phosphoglycerate dehydrogenase [Candidatus Desulfofervidus auxilii]|nr:phosphoglycerate dehydrogenase [Candidatus Desulfofervidus auxilii]